MDTNTVIAIVIVAGAILLLAVLTAAIWSRKRTRSLRERYGSEYDLAVKKRGRREHELEQREKRVAGLEIRDLTPSEHADFARQWTALQAQFVDAPRTALQYADVLVQQVMNARGYPMADFEQRAADVSVDHSSLVTSYRTAHKVSQTADTATTEQMRQAMLHYRSLFSELLGAPETVAAR